MDVWIESDDVSGERCLCSQLSSAIDLLTKKHTLVFSSGRYRRWYVLGQYVVFVFWLKYGSWIARIGNAFGSRESKRPLYIE